MFVLNVTDEKNVFIALVTWKMSKHFIANGKKNRVTYQERTKTMILRNVDGVDIPEEGWTRDQLIQYIKEHVVGDGMKEPKSPIDKYGYRSCGISDTWVWNTISPRLEDATDDELWKIVAINNTFWLHKYQKWYHDSEERNRKLNAEMK